MSVCVCCVQSYGGGAAVSGGGAGVSDGGGDVQVWGAVPPGGRRGVCV